MLVGESVCRLMEKELHFLHGYPRRAAPDRVSHYTVLQQMCEMCGDLTGAWMYLGSILATAHSPPAAALSPADQTVMSVQVLVPLT